MQAGHHLSRTFYHHHLDRRSQFPPTIGQPERLAAGNRRGQAEIHRKTSSASNQCGIWMCYLKAEVGSMVHSGAPSGSSQLTDSDEEWSCSHLMAGPRYTRVWHSVSKDVCGASVDEAMWSVVVGEATGGQSLSPPKVCPRMPKLNSFRRSIIRSC